jgi:hypothetical protein
MLDSQPHDSEWEGQSLMSWHGTGRAVEYRKELEAKAFGMDGHPYAECYAVIPAGKAEAKNMVKDHKAFQALQALDDLCDRAVDEVRMENARRRRADTASAVRFEDVTGAGEPRVYTCKCGRKMTLTEITENGQRCPRCYEEHMVGGERRKYHTPVR